MTQTPRRAVFLDRDGVLNDVYMEQGRPRSPRSLEEFRIDPKALPALERLHASGFLLIVVTNQPEVVRGFQTRNTVELMHKHLLNALPLDEIRTCFHDRQHDCPCRKPKPGMLLEAARTWGLELSECFVIGDRGKDIEAGHGAGCRGVLLERPYNTAADGAPDFVAPDLERAADAILAAAPSAAISAA